MRIGAVKSALLAGGACCVLAVGIGQAFAGGFAIREQSAFGQGSSYAGIAAGGALSGMFWNPAVMTQFSGVAVEADATAIFPFARQNPGAGTFPPLLALGGVGNSGEDALVPSMYASWQVSPTVWVGMSFNAPFGLSVKFPDVWAGRNYAGNTSLKTYNATPSVAVRVNDWLSLGAGVQIMYSSAKLRTGGAAIGSYVELSGNSWSYGFTAGATITPMPGTEIGIGWRSALDMNIDGSLAIVPPGIALPASTKVKLPDTVSLGLRQRINERFTLLGTIEWANWNRIGTSVVTVGLPPPAPILPFQYSDGWFFAIGGEYVYNERLTLRGGIGYEISPITDNVRTPRLPDNDRVWTSLGLSYKAGRDFVLDVAYSHLFVQHTPINIVPGNPWFPTVGVPYVGTVDSHVDILSVGLRYQFNPAPAGPALITKG
jgi:long-chain fatty acid transport protein